MRQASYDRAAPWYALLDRAAFGPVLRRCRHRFLPDAVTATRVLAFGDGEGHFVAALLARAPEAHVTAVDFSRVMLDRLAARVRRLGASSRLECVHADARAFVAPQGDYDLVVTHFVLDCLSTDEIEDLVLRTTRVLTSDARWIVSEFAIPPGRAQPFARGLIAVLYTAQRWLTGLDVSQLPDHASALRRHGFVLSRVHTQLAGVVRAELWSRSNERAAGSPQGDEAAEPTGGTNELFGGGSVLDSPVRTGLTCPVPLRPVPSAPSAELLDMPLVPVPVGCAPLGVVPAPRVKRTPLHAAVASAVRTRSARSRWFIEVRGA